MPEEALHAKNTRGHPCTIHPHQNTTIKQTQQLTFSLKYRIAFSSPGNFTMIFLILLPKAKQIRAQRIPLRCTMLLTPEPGTYADMICASKTNQHIASRNQKQTQVHPGSSHRPRMPRQANRLWGKLTTETLLQKGHPTPYQTCQVEDAENNLSCPRQLHNQNPTGRGHPGYENHAPRS